MEDSNLQGYYDFPKATIYRATRSGFRLRFILHLYSDKNIIKILNPIHTENYGNLASKLSTLKNTIKLKK